MGVSERLSPQEKLEFFNQLLQEDNAGLYASTVGDNPPVVFKRFLLDTASVAGNLAQVKVGFGFRSFVVLATSDPSISINMQLGTDGSTITDAFPVKNNSQLKLPFPINGAMLSWAAQAGGYIDILFFLRGEFSTNQLVSSLAAQTTPYTGGTVTSVAGAQATTAAAILFAADSSRYLMVIQNQSGQSVWIGGSTVTAKGGARPGIEIPPGGTYNWDSTGACYIITSGSSTGATDISLTKFAA